jgi:hypothetical protein
VREDSAGAVQRKRKRPPDGRSDTGASETAESKTCSKCGEIKLLSMFPRNSRRIDGRQSWCYVCTAEYNRERDNTRTGFLRRAWNNMRNTARHRGSLGRHTASICTLQFGALLCMLEQQQERCAISSLPVVCMRSSDWMVSIDRIDDDKGYTMSNTRLIASELNTTEKWSRVGLLRLREMARQPPLSNEEWQRVLASADTRAKVHTKSFLAPLVKTQSEGETLFGCQRCNSLWLPDELLTSLCLLRCWQCRNDYDFALHTASVERELSWLTTTMRSSNTSRNKMRVKAGRPALPFGMARDDMHRVFRAQRGACAYSNIPFHLPGVHGGDQHTELLRRMSPERIDPRRGYEPGNVCFVLRGFQSADHSPRVKYSNGGSAGWSKMKVDYLWKWLDEEAAGATQPSMTWAQFQQQQKSVLQQGVTMD